MIFQKLWNIDPGYFRLKHAAKTILAILITLWLLKGEEKVFSLMGGVVSGFSMQGVVAQSFTSRIKQIIALNIGYFLAFVLGLVARNYPYGTATILVLVGFVGNYLRRFGLQNSVAPMMGWTLCFFATILPFSNVGSTAEPIYWLIIALFVSGVVNGVVFAENYPRLFVDNTNRIFKTLTQAMHEIRRHLLVSQGSFDKTPFNTMSDALMRLLDSNQAMDESGVFDGHQINTLLIHQYALVHIYMMMIDAFETLAEHQHHLSLQARVGFSRIFRQLEMLFNSTVMRDNYSVTTNRDLMIISKQLSYVPPSDPAVILVLLNLKLGFSLLNQHMTQLIRGINET